MVSRPSFYSTGGTSFSDGSRSEIDLRERFDDLIYGSNGGIPHGHLVLIRKMRRDSDGERIECSCKEGDNVSEPSYSCSYCLGEGFLWDEEWRICYSMQTSSESGFVRKYQHVAPGHVRVDYTIFFFDYRTEIRYHDKIIEVLLDKDGQPVLPYIRSTIYRPETILNFRSDNGRTEYLSVYCRESDAIRGEFDGG